jgi:uncharacterized membrane-anchored protein
VVAQILAKKFHPFLYWATIVASTTFGTTMADFLAGSGEPRAKFSQDLTLAALAQGRLEFVGDVEMILDRLWPGR